MLRLLLIILIFCFIIVLFGCNKDTLNSGENGNLSESQALQIARDDINQSTPNLLKTNLYKIERKNMKIRNYGDAQDSWVVILRSIKEGNKLGPMMLYQIDAKNGEILDKGQYLKAF